MTPPKDKPLPVGEITIHHITDASKNQADYSAWVGGVRLGICGFDEGEVIAQMEEAYLCDLHVTEDGRLIDLLQEGNQ